jgi:hypothetical protein
MTIAIFPAASSAGSIGHVVTHESFGRVGGEVATGADAYTGVPPLRYPPLDDVGCPTPA